MDDFVRCGRTFGAGELNVKYVGNFSDERQPARQFPADFLRLFPEPLRLGLLRGVVHGTRVLHGRCTGGARSRRRGIGNVRENRTNERSRTCTTLMPDDILRSRLRTELGNGMRTSHHENRKRHGLSTTDTPKTNAHGPAANDCRQPAVRAHDFSRRRRCSAAPFERSGPSVTGPRRSRAQILIVFCFVFWS